jgi:hypothetical protein
MEAYVQAVIQEAEFYTNRILPLSERGNKGDLNPSQSPFSKGRDSNLSFQTLYIGGGTPSLLGVKHLQQLINGLKRTLNFEYGNPNQLPEAVQKCRPESFSKDEGSPCVSQGDSSGTSYPQKDI